MSAISMVLVFYVSGVFAANDALSCRLMMHETGTADSYTSESGRVLSLSKHNGVATCDDGRLLQAQIMQSELQLDNERQVTGFGVYSFENGDTVTVKIRGNENSEDVSMNYTVIAGSGNFLNATGTGAIQLVKRPWSNTFYFDLTLVIHQP